MKSGYTVQSRVQQSSTGDIYESCLIAAHAFVVSCCPCDSSQVWPKPRVRYPSVPGHVGEPVLEAVGREFVNVQLVPWASSVKTEPCF